MSKQDISFRIGEQTHIIVKDEVVNGTDKYGSIKRFYETAVQNNVHNLQALASGGEQARTLVKLLGQIRGITISDSEIEDNSRAYILDGEVSKAPLRIELSLKHKNSLSEVQEKTGLSRSEVIRRCIFCQLSQLVQQYGLLDGWRESEIQKTWEEVEAGLQRPKVNLYNFLTQYFVDEQQITRRRIEEDYSAFEYFAEEYTEKFYSSDCHDQLLEKRSERTFTNVENMIEEYTDHRIDHTETSRETSRFETTEFLNELNNI